MLPYLLAAPGSCAQSGAIAPAARCWRVGFAGDTGARPVGKRLPMTSRLPDTHALERLVAYLPRLYAPGF